MPDFTAAIEIVVTKRTRGKFVKLGNIAKIESFDNEIIKCLFTVWRDACNE